MLFRERFVDWAVLLLVGALFTPLPIYADTIAVIGTGDVASALGPEFAAQGHTIVYGSRDPSRDEVRALVERTGGAASATTPAKAVAGADIVVMAVPGTAVEAVTNSLGDLSGKIIIDPTNAIDRSNEGYLELVYDTSAAEIIQGAAPGAYVVKAFNTLNWRTMVDPDSSGGPVSIPLVGDSAAAKATVAELVEGMGLEAIDLGPLRYARHVEGMLLVWIHNRYGGGDGAAFDYHLRKTQ
jgi:predicted dinucleotide-binding enzyme